MGYKSDGAATSKLEYASYLAAALAYLTAFKHDPTGLVTFDDRILEQIPARQGPGHLRLLMEKLEQMQAGTETSLSKVFHELAESLKRPAMVVIFSDLFDDTDGLEDNSANGLPAPGGRAAKGFEKAVRAFQLLDATPPSAYL